jgi:hypothetical protein
MRAGQSVSDTFDHRSTPDQTAAVKLPSWLSSLLMAGADHAAIPSRHVRREEPRRRPRRRHDQFWTAKNRHVRPQANDLGEFRPQDLAGGG